MPVLSRAWSNPQYGQIDLSVPFPMIAIVGVMLLMVLIVAVYNTNADSGRTGG
jgi:apolipoprotein N-acyltransferase